MLGRHFEFAPLSEVLADNAAGGGSRRLAVTFDDGFDLIAGGALDVLDAHGVKATSFVLTAMLGNRGLMWRNKLSAIIRRCGPPERCASRLQRDRWRASGLPEIGDATELLSAAMGWDMARKDELADELLGGVRHAPAERVPRRAPPVLHRRRPGDVARATATRWGCTPRRIPIARASTPRACASRSSTRPAAAGRPGARVRWPSRIPFGQTLLPAQ